MSSFKRTRVVALTRLLVLAHVASVLLSGCGGSGGGGGGGSKQNVTLFASKSKLTAANGAAAVQPLALFETSGGAILLTDSTSSAVLAILSDGSVIQFASKLDLTSVTGQPTVTLGAFDEINLGVLAGRLIVADSVSGNVLTLLGTGTPALFSTLAKVAAVTGKASARMSLPLELTSNQIVAQDLESIDMVKYDASGNVTPFVGGAAIAAAAGVPVGQAIVVQWARGPVSNNLFGRFSSTSNIVRVQINGTVSQYVSSATLKSLFSDVVDLRVLDIVVSPQSDTLLLLIGEGTKGVAVAIVSSNGAVSVYVSKSTMAKGAGNGVNISDLSVLNNGIAVAVDRGDAQVLTFGDRNGQITPVIVGRGQDIRDVTGTMSPLLSLSAGLPTGAAVVFDEDSDGLIEVQ